jgi:hypothetical protein
MPIMTEVVQAIENSPVKAIKKAKLFHPVGKVSAAKPTVV